MYRPSNVLPNASVSKYVLQGWVDDASLWDYLLGERDRVTVDILLPNEMPSRSLPGGSGDIPHLSDLLKRARTGKGKEAHPEVA